MVQKITRLELQEALTAFPADTGLGWDALHPRALTRLSADLLDELIRYKQCVILRKVCNF